MAGATKPTEISRTESFGSWRLWFAVLGAPAAWIVHLVVGYSLEEWFACSPSVTDAGEILGLSVRQVALILTGITAAVAVAAGVTALSCLRKINAGGNGESQRPRWMAVAGIMNSILYLLIILGGTAPALILNACETSP